MHICVLIKSVLLLCLSGRSEEGWQQANESEKAFVMTKKYVWPQNKGYVGGAIC